MPRQVVTRPITVTASTLPTRAPAELAAAAAAAEGGDDAAAPGDAAQAAVDEVAAEAAAVLAAAAEPAASAEPAAAATAAPATPEPQQRRRRRVVQEVTLGGAGVPAQPPAPADPRQTEVPGSRLPHEVSAPPGVPLPVRAAPVHLLLGEIAGPVGMLAMAAYAVGLPLERFVDEAERAIAVLRRLQAAAHEAREAARPAAAESTEPPPG